METTAIDTLFTAVDISGISSNTQTLLLGFIGINLLILGYVFVRKVMSKGQR